MNQDAYIGVADETNVDGHDRRLRRFLWEQAAASQALPCGSPRARSPRQNSLAIVPVPVVDLSSWAQLPAPQRTAAVMNKEKEKPTLESELASLDKKKRMKRIGDSDYITERKRVLAKYQTRPKKKTSKTADEQLRKARWALLLKFLESKEWMEQAVIEMFT